MTEADPFLANIPSAVNDLVPESQRVIYERNELMTVPPNETLLAAPYATRGLEYLQMRADGMSWVEIEKKGMSEYTGRKHVAYTGRALELGGQRPAVSIYKGILWKKITYQREDPIPDPELSEGEMLHLYLLCMGFSQVEAASLDCQPHGFYRRGSGALSPRAARGRIEVVRSKLGARSREHAISRAFTAGIFSSLLDRPAAG